jgi:hypothetical protein
MRLLKFVIPVAAALGMSVLPLSASSVAVPQHPSGQGADQVVAVAPEGVVKNSETAAAAPQCWTSFNPSVPGGGPMTQTYNNCSPVAVTVTPAYTLSASVYVFVTTCVTLDPGEYVDWHYDATVPNAVYTTVVCRY